MASAINMEEITEARRKSIAETIKTINIAELKTLCEGLFPYIDHPWRDPVFTFIGENSHATFHHAMTNDHAHIIYCHSEERGMWFVPGIGMGPLQEKGRKLLKEIVEGKH